MLDIDKSKNRELGKLIQYGYDLHKEEMDYFSHTLPSLEFYNGDCCPVKKIENGGVFGHQGYPNHSFSYVCTMLGVCVGQSKENGFDLDYALLFQTDNDEFRVDISILKLNEETKHWYPTLSYDHSSYINLTNEEKLKLFIKGMKFIGFREEDIINVIKGNISARQAYVNVAPEDKKNIEWVNKDRRYFVFDKNVAIEGNFGSMNMDDFPFPFSEQPVLDCSKVKTCCVNFGINSHKVKLINVNHNRESIKYTNLRNAIIEEPIDLSLVDATWTKFGHHVVINLDNSIAKLKDIDISLAINENGEKYVIDEQGQIMTLPIENIMKKTNIQVLSNADNLKMAKRAFDNEADGIGLVRTEHIFQEIEDVEKMINLLTDWISNETYVEFVDKVKLLQKNQAREIFSQVNNKKVIFRLMDFKIKDNVKLFGIDCDLKAIDIDYTRGTFGLMRDYKELFVSQLEGIFEEAIKADNEINLLLPMISNVNEFIWIKEEIIKISQKHNINKIRIGAMIENVEIANDADMLAKEVDFLSIGTNDLTESITGLSRETNSIEFQQLNNEVKDTIKEIIYRARSSKNDIVIGICGEHSNYIENIQFYSNIGVNYVTCSPEFVKPNKEYLNFDKNNQIKVVNKRK